MPGTGDSVSKQKPTKSDKLTKRQRLFIPVLLQSKSITEACQKSGLDRSQFYQWRGQDAFRTAIDAAQREIVADAMGVLKLNLSGAAGKLSMLLNSQDEAIQLRAANSLLEHHARLVEAQEIETRLTEIEKQCQEQQETAGAVKSR